MDEHEMMVAAAMDAGLPEDEAEALAEDFRDTKHCQSGAEVAPSGSGGGGDYKDSEKNIMQDAATFLAGLATNEERTLAQAIFDGAEDTQIIETLGVEQAQVDKMRVIIAETVLAEQPSSPTQTDAAPQTPEVPAADTGVDAAPAAPQA